MDARKTPGDVPVERLLEKAFKHPLRRDVKHSALDAMQAAPPCHGAFAATGGI